MHEFDRWSPKKLAIFWGILFAMEKDKGEQVLKRSIHMKLLRFVSGGMWYNVKRY